jgi:hypothetical protein
LSRSLDVFAKIEKQGLKFVLLIRLCFVVGRPILAIRLAGCRLDFHRFRNGCRSIGVPCCLTLHREFSGEDMLALETLLAIGTSVGWLFVVQLDDRCQTCSAQAMIRRPCGRQQQPLQCPRRAVLVRQLSCDLLYGLYTDLKENSLENSVFCPYTSGMAKRGRPKKAADQTKGDYIELRVGVDEKQAFVDAANLHGMALSVWIREKLRRAARKELEDAEKPVAFLDKVSA